MELGDIPLFAMLKSRLGYLSDRQRVIAENVANANTPGYQARDLKIRTKRANGGTELVHTNDATAFALGRIMIAIMENCQTADGNINIPEVLKPFMVGV